MQPRGSSWPINDSAEQMLAWSASQHRCRWEHERVKVAARDLSVRRNKRIHPATPFLAKPDEAFAPRLSEMIRLNSVTVH